MIPDEILHREGFCYLNTRASHLLFVLRKDGRIVQANDSATRVTGDNIIGKNFCEVLVDFTWKADLHSFALDSSEEYIMSIGTVSGLPQSYYFTFQQVAEDIIAFGRLDVEELESMRKEILVLNQELNNATRELHKKNATLKRLNAEKNRFLGMAAHDLRKPIGLLMTYSGFLVEETADVLNSEHLGFLETIHASCGNMAQLVDDLLDVSAIEAGVFPLRLEHVNLAALFSASLEPNRVQACQKGVQLDVDCRGLSGAILDAAKIEQVIGNLVANAIEYSVPGAVVAVRLTCDDRFIRFFVQDHGSGILPEEVGQLFKPFQKASTVKTAGERSTGLGLLISRKIIDAHSGKIWVDSQPGQGSTFHFEIPAQGDNHRDTDEYPFDRLSI
ncbi:Signal transduction histidine kinase [Candidatus Electrothrix aarhusensis]|uniref:histidine kinase n=1 Tax=Candidatus Electrothrix aarhusensis TaxID=1859131 RepID=A0A3S3QWA7_9BACT|nr:Signal transduction histidine kinase [Candidatus Electrothrix aarhusensis]